MQQILVYSGTTIKLSLISNGHLRTILLFGCSNLLVDTLIILLSKLISVSDSIKSLVISST